MAWHRRGGAWHQRASRFGNTRVTRQRRQISGVTYQCEEESSINHHHASVSSGIRYQRIGGISINISGGMAWHQRRMAYQRANMASDAISGVIMTSAKAKTASVASVSAKIMAKQQ